MNILTLNAGSNSLKFEIVAQAPRSGDNETSFGPSVVAGSYDDIGKENSRFALLDNKRPGDERTMDIRDHGHATELLFDWLETGNPGGAGASEIALAHVCGL